MIKPPATLPAAGVKTIQGSRRAEVGREAGDEKRDEQEHKEQDARKAAARQGSFHLTSASLRSSICPGIDHFNPGSLKAAHISCRNRRASTTGYGRYLAVGMADGTPRSASRGVGPGCSTIKGKDASIKILPQHPFHRFKQSVSSSTGWQYLNAVQQFSFADSGQIQICSRLFGNPIHNVGTGVGAHQLRNDIGVQDDHLQSLQSN